MLVGFTVNENTNRLKSYTRFDQAKLKISILTFICKCRCLQRYRSELKFDVGVLFSNINLVKSSIKLNKKLASFAYSLYQYYILILIYFFI